MLSDFPHSYILTLFRQKMSFRSRTRTKPTVPVRRSTSLTRPSSSSGNSRGYTPSSAYGGYQSGSNYLNPYHSGLEPASYSPRNSGYFDYATGGSGSGGSKRRESYGSNTSLNALMYSNPLAMGQNPYSYKSPYKDRDRYGNNSTASYTSPYNNRYVSPYSTYENGVTTAGLSFHATAGHSGGTNLAPTSKLATSNTSLNHYLSPTTKTAHLARSASLRDQERKSRNRNRKQAPTTSQTPSTPRSLSVSSVHSDIGYEVGFVVDVLSCLYFSKIF